MKKERAISPRFRFVLAVFLILLCARIPGAAQSSPAASGAADNTAKRRAFLTQLLETLPADPEWNDWLHRTGELPPDFDALPNMMDLPDPLQMEEHGKQVRISTKEQWARKRVILRELLEHYVTGSFPPAPANVEGQVQNESTEGDIITRDVLLSFGSQQKGKLHLQLFIPPGRGPFPVFMTAAGKHPWVEIAVRRGYLGCIIAAGDSADDTELFAPLYPDYDFTSLGRRVWGISRAIDYLTTLPIVDSAKITFTDHSRGGKLATWAAAFEERLTAVVGSSPVAGGAIPWRYSADRYADETLEMSTRNYPHWYHPRLRFFVGRENKLPVDMHEMLALIAPRAYMLTLGMNEGEVNAWGEERGYLAAQKVYELLGAKDRFALRFRPGIHPTYGSDIEEYLDWYDTVLSRRKFPLPNTLLYNYSFDKWKALSGEDIDPKTYPVKPLENTLGAKADWSKKREELRAAIRWGLGDSPPHIPAQGPRSLTSSPPGAEPPRGGYTDKILNRPRPTDDTDRSALSGGNLDGVLYYPRRAPPAGKMPVVIWLHPYSYSTGYSRLPIVPTLPDHEGPYMMGTFPLGAEGYLGTDFKVDLLVRDGFAIFTYDMIGFGARMPEVQRFYERFPHWSLMGKMIDDVRSAVDLLSSNDRIDPRRIYVMGYSLGGTVGLLSAALDDRIAGAAVVSGFTPLRTETPEKGTGSLDNLAFIHGLMPRLGFFKGNENRLPWDFSDVMALVAPRPLIVTAPQYDQEATLEDVKHSVEDARRVYELLDTEERSAVAYDYNWSGIWRSGVSRSVHLRNLELYSPPDYNHFPNSMQSVIYHWMQMKLLGQFSSRRTREVTTP